MASSTTPIPPMRADWTASGACTNGSTAPPRGAMRRASGGAATTSTPTKARALAEARLQTLADVDAIAVGIGEHEVAQPLGDGLEPRTAHPNCSRKSPRSGPSSWSTRGWPIGAGKLQGLERNELEAASEDPDRSVFR